MSSKLDVVPDRRQAAWITPGRLAGAAAANLQQLLAGPRASSPTG